MRDEIKAVALKYPENKEAPVIAAKEKGLLAKRMLQIAEENNIPVREDSLLTDILSVQEIGNCIPENTWQAVAEIFAYIRGLENKNGSNIQKN